MAYLSLDPVLVALKTALGVAGMTALVGTRVYADVPRAPVYPFVWIEVSEPRDIRGFGTGGVPEVGIRVHAFSTYQGEYECHQIIGKAIELLRDQSLTVTGYAQAGQVFYDETVTLRDQEIEGVKVQEVVAVFRSYFKES